MEQYMILIAVIIDLMIGDPDFYPHPVIIIGKAIRLLEKILTKFATGKFKAKIAGIILVAMIVSLTFLSTYSIIKLADQININLGVIVNVLLLSTTVATTGLVKAGSLIYEALQSNNLSLARQRLALIVGRDTEQLTEDGVIRATIETMAENTSDGIIAPLFYATLGGLPLAMAYKAVNTLDSMLGYKNEKYRHFGWAAARLDDLANFIPARLTALLFIAAAFILRQDWLRAAKTVLKDAKKHPSPNAGFPEAAIAGALKIRLGGLNYYQGQQSLRAYLGEALIGFKAKQIKVVIRLIYLNLLLFMIFYFFFKALL